MTAIKELLEEIYAIADNDEPDEGYGFPKITNLSSQALALLAERCEWRFDLHHGMWDTSCGNAYCTTEGDTLKQHGIKGCPFCVRPIKELKNEQST